MGKERHAVDSDDCSSETEKADEVEEEEPSEVDSEEEPIEEDPFEEEPDEEDPCEEEPSEEGSCEEEPDEDPYDESNIESLHGQEPNEVLCEEEPNRQASCEEVVIEGHSCESSREDETNEEPFEEDRHEEEYEIEQPEDSEPDEEEYEEYEEQCEEEPSEEPSEEEPNEPGEPSGDDRYTSQSNPEKRNRSADAISGPKVSIGSLSINFLETPQNMSNNVMAPEKLDNAKGSGRKRRSRWDVEAGSNGTADGSIDVAKKERKSRWSSDHSQLNSTAVVSDHDVVFYQEVVKLHAQLFEITQKLQARELVDERPDGERSPSPPLYNNLGMKINSREIRLRETLKLQRQMIISELIQKNPNYIPPPDFKSPNRRNSPTLTPIPKFCKKLYIPSKEYPEYNFAGLIIGPRGNTQKRMEKETGAKICLRGKGSVVEGKHKKPKLYDNDDDLHVLVEAGSKGSLDAAVAMVEKLLIPVEDGRNVHKLAQLQELATLNGTLRNKRLCDVCGDATHYTSACPLTASDPGANTNDHEVNYLSELRGAFLGSKETDYTNLYVGHLPHSVDDNKLVELFSPFGQICESQVIRDKNTGLSRCYGFVKYVDNINATTAVTRMNGYIIDGQMLVVRAAGVPVSPDKPKTGTGGFPSLHQLPQYPGYAAIAHSNPGPMCWPGPPQPVLPEPGASCVKNEPPPGKPKTGTGDFPSLHQLPQYPGYAATAHSNPGPMCWPGSPRPMLPEPGASCVKNEPPPDKPKTGTGGFPSLYQLPQYPGYAAIAHSNPGPMCWPGPPRPVLPEPGASFVKKDSNAVYHYPFHGQSSVSLGPFCQPPPPSTLLSRDVAASDELANFPGYLKSLGPPSQLLQASQTRHLSSSQVHFTPNFSYPYMPPP